MNRFWGFQNTGSHKSWMVMGVIPILIPAGIQQGEGVRGEGRLAKMRLWACLFLRVPLSCSFSRETKRKTTLLAGSPKTTHPVERTCQVQLRSVRVMVAFCDSKGYCSVSYWTVEKVKAVSPNG